MKLCPYRKKCKEYDGGETCTAEIYCGFKSGYRVGKEFEGDKND